MQVLNKDCYKILNCCRSHQKMFQNVCLVVNVEKNERWTNIKLLIVLNFILYNILRQ
jgi:hypothetical protein